MAEEAAGLCWFFTIKPRVNRRDAERQPKMIYVYNLHVRIGHKAYGAIITAASKYCLPELLDVNCGSKAAHAEEVPLSTRGVTLPLQSTNPLAA